MKFNLLDKWTATMNRAISLCGELAVLPIRPARFFWNLGRACTDPGGEGNWAAYTFKGISGLLFLGGVAGTLITLPIGGVLGISAIAVELAGIPFAVIADLGIAAVKKIKEVVQRKQVTEETLLLAEAEHPHYGSDSTTVLMAEMRSQSNSGYESSLLADHDRPPSRKKPVNADGDAHDQEESLFDSPVSLFGEQFSDEPTNDSQIDQPSRHSLQQSK